MAELRDRSSSTEPQLKFPGCSHYRRRSDTHFHCQQCHLNEGLTLCTHEAPCDVCKDWLPEAWEALEKAAQQKRKHKAAAAARAVKKSQEMDDSIEIHAPEEGIQVPPAKRRDDSRPRRRRERNQPPHLRLRRQSLPTGLPGPVTRRGPFHPASLWWEDPGPTAAQCLPGPTDLNTIDHAVVIEADEVTGRTDVTTHQGPATRPDVEGVGRGASPRLWEGPALEPGTLTRRMLQGLVLRRGGRRRSGLLVLPLIINIITQSHRRILGPGPGLSIMTDVRVWTAWGLGRHTCPDVRSSCPRSHHNWLRRGPSQWSLCLRDQHRRTTRQVCRPRQTLFGSGGARDCVRLSSCCWPSTGSGPGRCRLSTPTGLCRWRLGTPTGLSRLRLGVMGRRPRVPRQGLRWLQDKTPPWFLMSAVWCFRLFRETSTSWLHVNVDSHATKDGLGYGSSRHPVQARWPDTVD